MQKDVKIHLDSMYSSKFANREFFVIMKKRCGYHVIRKRIPIVTFSVSLKVQWGTETFWNKIKTTLKIIKS